MFYGDRVVTVNGETATINKPVILYRGDYNVQVKFKIMEIPFTQKVSATDLLAGSDASYGQLLIRIADGRLIFGEMTEINNNSITFTFTADMLDEVEELGDYELQIRLFDEDRTSRVTLPPISGALKVKEPFAFGDDSTSNLVDEAMTDYAIVTYADPLDVFDSNGDYIETTWTSGEVISSAKLNKIEQGISGVNEKISNINIPTNVSQLTNDSNYATETYVTNAIANAQLGGSGGGNVALSNDYSYEYMGTPFPALDNYQSWPIAGVQYDKSIDRIVCLVTDADKHVDSTQFKLSLYTLNPQTAEIKLIQTLRDNTVDPVVNLSDAFHSQRGFLIDNDTGIYYKFHFGDDYIPKACKSEDKGVTWTDIPINQTNTAWTVGGNGQIIKTSTGRIICGLFGNGVAYTDDYFANLTYCNNAKLSSNGGNTCHEYEIIEYPDGTLQRLMRKTWQSTNNGVWNGTKIIEPAWVSTSNDNGVTWTTPVASNSIVNMSATNCVSYIDGDILNLFVGCRYPVTDNAVSAMFYYQCTLDDAKNDDFGEPTTLFYGNTDTYINFGNLAGCKDDKGNFHLLYNDNVLSAMGSEECRWHYIRIAKNVVNNNAILDVPVNKSIQTYNASMIDSLLEVVYAYIGDVKNELLIKIGEMPDSGDVNDPTYWISDGLISMFTIDEEHFDTSNSKFTPTVGDYLLYVAGGDYNYSPQSTYSNLILYSNDKNLLNDTFINSTEGYTIEVDYITRYEDGSGTTRPFNLNSSGQIGFVGTWFINLLSYSTSSNATKSEATAEITKSFDSSRKRNTLTFTYDRINNISSVYSNGVQILTSEGLTVTEGNSWDIAQAYNINSRLDRLALMKGEKSSIRCYNKPLTAEQILTNANYSNK